MSTVRFQMNVNLWTSLCPCTCSGCNARRVIVSIPSVRQWEDKCFSSCVQKHGFGIWQHTSRRWFRFFAEAKVWKQQQAAYSANDRKQLIPKDPPTPNCETSKRRQARWPHERFQNYPVLFIGATVFLLLGHTSLLKPARKSLFTKK